MNIKGRTTAMRAGVAESCSSAGKHSAEADGRRAMRQTEARRLTVVCGGYGSPVN
jgi:hypothetical protein